MKPMLAKKYDDQNPKGWWMSEKLDGVRAIWTGTKLISRSGKEFAAPAWFTAGLQGDIILDGELWEGRGLFQQTCGKVRTKSNPDWAGIKYVLFDCIVAGGFEKRMQRLKALTLPDCAEILEQILCTGREHLLRYETRILNSSGEGVMLRRPGSLYENRRSGSLLKVKRFTTDEAEVIDYEAGNGRNKGRVGALMCKFRDNIIAIGAGLTDSDRQHPPGKGVKVTFSYFELTESGMPRFPFFIGCRDYE